MGYLYYEEEYPDGMEMNQFESRRIDEVSAYNSNYYMGLKNTILYAKSDDDNMTEWFLHFEDECVFLGESYTSEGDILHRMEKRIF